MAGLSGKKGSVVIGGTTEQVQEWTADVSVAMLPDDTESTGTGSEFVPGRCSIVGTFRTNYDPEHNDLDTGLVPGTAVTNLYLYTNTPASNKVTIATAYIESASISVSIRGTVQLTVAFRANGVTAAAALTDLDWY